jgi:hypothetical protein
MDTRLTATRGIWRLHIATAVVLALVMVLGATTPTAASPTACRVQNTITGKTYTALQPAVDAAKKDDRLTVLGTCVGNSVIDKKLVIEGVRSSTSGKPILDGDGRDRVLVVQRGTKVAVEGLIIRHGAGRLLGGGMNNKGDLILRDVVVSGNAADATGSGGGIWNGGRLHLTGSTSVRGNTAGGVAGIMNFRGYVSLSGSTTVTGNSATTFGGGFANYQGTLSGVICTPEVGANVYGNSPDDCVLDVVPDATQG